MNPSRPVDRSIRLTLTLTTERLAVCRLEPSASTPAWLDACDGFASITRTAQEVSIVCNESAVPESIDARRGWRRLEVDGPLDFNLVGILDALAAPLARIEVPIFVLSTYRTDSLLIAETDCRAALDALRAAGHTIRNEAP